MLDDIPWKLLWRYLQKPRGMLIRSTVVYMSTNFRLNSYTFNAISTLLWRHNGRDGFSNHHPHHCLNRSFRCRSKKTSNLRVTGLIAGNSQGTGEFSAQMASNAENVSIWRRLHGKNLDDVANICRNACCGILLLMNSLGNADRHESRLNIVIWWTKSSCGWTHCGLVTLYDDKGLGQHGLKQWLVAYRH